MYPQSVLGGIICALLLVQFGTSDDFSLQSGAIAAETSGPRFERQSKRELTKPPVTESPPKEEEEEADSTSQKTPDQGGQGRGIIGFGSALIGTALKTIEQATGTNIISSPASAPVSMPPPLTVGEDEDIVFKLCKKKNKEIKITEESKGPAAIDAWKDDQDVIIIVHGWMESGISLLDSAQMIKNAYLDDDRSSNIIILDWGKHSAFLDYPSASKNVQRVGIKLADFIVNLIDKKFVKDLNNIHIVGFSLGGHIAGVAGYRVQQKLYGKKVGWITGLDPNRENFGTTVDKDRRLTADDAEFVDVIHCNMGKESGFGTALVSGTADFFPNGGVHQPNCDLNGMGEAEGICSTKKCYEYYVNSITGMKYKGCKCSSFKAYEEEQCEKCDTLMGDQVPKATANGKYYFRTK